MVHSCLMFSKTKNKNIRQTESSAVPTFVLRLFPLLSKETKAESREMLFLPASCVHGNDDWWSKADPEPAGAQPLPPSCPHCCNLPCTLRWSWKSLLIGKTMAVEDDEHKGTWGAVTILRNSFLLYPWYNKYIQPLGCHI